MLKSAISILMSFSILMQGLNFHVSDMIELKVLINHLEEHQTSFGDDVFTFFDKHYGDLRLEHEQEEHEGSSRHEQLPFKHKICSFSVGVLINSFGGPERSQYVAPALSIRNYGYLDNYSFLDLTDIFQPPRFF